MNKRAVGSACEDAAADMLASSGYSIVHRSYRLGRLGEIDIVARCADVICFIEVKARSSERFGAPSEAVGWEKRRTIAAIASHYMAVHRKRDGFGTLQPRFDVIEARFTLSEAGAVVILSLNHIMDAFRV